MGTPKEISRQTLQSGKFIKFEEITWLDAQGKQRRWEVVERVIGADAVMIVPWMRPSNQLILIRQFRPPAGGYILEFPAGLVDPGETPQQAAKRELIEETGYKGEISGIIPPTFNTPGLSGETVFQVFMEVPDGQKPKAEPEEGEHIELQLLPHEGIQDFIRTEIAAGTKFDSKVMGYLLGIISARIMGDDNWLQRLPTGTDK